MLGYFGWVPGYSKTKLGHDSLPSAGLHSWECNFYGRDEPEGEWRVDWRFLSPGHGCTGQVYLQAFVVSLEIQPPGHSLVDAHLAEFSYDLVFE